MRFLAALVLVGLAGVLAGPTGTLTDSRLLISFSSPTGSAFSYGALTAQAHMGGSASNAVDMVTSYLRFNISTDTSSPTYSSSDVWSALLAASPAAPFNSFIRVRGLATNTLYSFQVVSPTTPGYTILQGNSKSIPGAPKNLAVSYVASTSMTLVWDAPSSSGGSSISGYRIYMQVANLLPSADDFSKMNSDQRNKMLASGITAVVDISLKGVTNQAAGLIEFVGDDSTWVPTTASKLGSYPRYFYQSGLNFSTTYNFRVTAYNSYGESVPSKPLPVVTQPNPCASNPCGSHGTCTPLAPGPLGALVLTVVDWLDGDDNSIDNWIENPFTCDCDNHYYGMLCNRACTAGNCADGTLVTCDDDGSSRKCNGPCNNGYIGNDCSQTVNCGSPNIGSKGIVSCKNTRWDPSASDVKKGCTFSCSSNYVLQGVSAMLCPISGTWPTLPSCVASGANCGWPAIPANGVNATCSGGTNVGATCTFACQSGYKLDSSANVNCPNSAVWGTLPKCIPVDCGVPRTPDYGLVPVCSSGTSRGRCCSFRCTTGYSFDDGDNGDLTCPDSGNWPTPPRCNPVKCGQPVPMPGRNSNCTDTNSWFFNKICKFGCDTGYTLSGWAYSVCLANAFWSPMPTCVAQSCAMATVANANPPVCTLGSRINSTCQITCKPGYKLSSGNGIVNCPIANNPTWNPSLPTCVEQRCAAIPLSSPLASTCNNATTAVGGTCTLTCLPVAGSSSVRGINTVKCVQLSDGTAAWNGSTTVSCASSNVNCSAIPNNNPYQSSCTSGTSPAGATCTITCAAGYNAASVTRTCDPTGAWSNPATPTCTLVTCPAQTGSFINDCSGDVAVGQSCHLACPSGQQGTTVTSTCVANGNQGAWSAGSPSCSITTCAVAYNGTTTTTGCGSTVNVGQSCAFSCVTGYNATSVTRNCVQSTVGGVAGFDGTPINCQPVKCTTLITLANAGNPTTTGSTYGSVATYKCNTGYVTSNAADPTSVCQSNGVWSTPAACNIRNCGTLTIPNGNHNCTSAPTTYGQRCLVTCVDNTYIQNGQYTQCLDTGVWSTLPTCTKNYNCNAPPSVPNGAVQPGCPTTDGSTCSVTCNDPYHINGPASTKCTQGTWSAPGSCDPDVCPAIASTTAYSSSCPGGVSAVNSHCILTCNAGYTGTALDRTCNAGTGNANGTWSGTTTQPDCQPTTCTISPSSNADSSCTGTSTNYGTQCTLTCKHGFAGNTVISTCQQTSAGAPGAFAPSYATSCGATTCTALADQTAYTTNCGANAAVDSTCTLTCASGYTGSPTTGTCVQDSTGQPAHWSFTPPTCNPTYCTSLPGGTNYDSSCFNNGATVAVNADCTLSCAAGYAGTPVTYRCSQTSGGPASFPTITPPSCTIVDCGDYKSLHPDANAVITCSGHTYLQSCDVTCNAGYQTSSHVVCGADGQWSTATACTALSCAAPSLPNGVATCTNNRPVGSTCNFTCNDAAGYQLQGPSSATCVVQSSNYVTYDHVPTCVLKNCGLPANPDSGTFSCPSSTQVGSNCTLSCLDGFDVTGTALVICPASGTWPSLPTCKVRDCGIPPLLNGQVNCPSTVVDSTCTLLCQQSYKLTQASNQVTCPSSGHWTNLPTCIPTKCDALPAGANFMSTCAEGPVSVGQTCTRSCNTGFAGTPVVSQCGQDATNVDATWNTQATPQCVTATCMVPGNDAYDSTCTTNAVVALGTQCTLSCKQGFDGSSVVQTCQQTAAGAGGTFSTNLPSCTDGRDCAGVYHGTSVFDGNNTCCPAASIASGSHLCCPPGLMPDSSPSQTCCLASTMDCAGVCPNADGSPVNTHDNNNGCCPPVGRDQQGNCCPAGQVTDKNNRCCTSGEMDKINNVCCASRYNGTLDCNGVCNGPAASDRDGICCSNVNFIRCDTGRCDEGHAVCRGNGHCDGHGGCVCNDGFIGAQCFVECAGGSGVEYCGTPTCNNHGQCNCQEKVDADGPNVQCCACTCDELFTAWPFGGAECQCAGTGIQTSTSTSIVVPLEECQFEGQTSSGTLEYACEQNVFDIQYNKDTAFTIEMWVRVNLTNAPTMTAQGRAIPTEIDYDPTVGPKTLVAKRGCPKYLGNVFNNINQGCEAVYDPDCGFAATNWALSIGTAGQQLKDESSIRFTVGNVPAITSTQTLRATDTGVNGWHHVAVSYQTLDFHTASVKLYIDHHLDVDRMIETQGNINTYTGVDCSAVNDGNIQVGYDLSNQQSLLANLDEFRFWTSIRTLDQITGSQFYFNEVAEDPSLPIYFPFNDATGVTNSASGNAPVTSNPAIVGPLTVAVTGPIINGVSSPIFRLDSCQSTSNQIVDGTGQQSSVDKAPGLTTASKLSIGFGVVIFAVAIILVVVIRGIRRRQRAERSEFEDQVKDYKRRSVMNLAYDQLRFDAPPEEVQPFTADDIEEVIEEPELSSNPALIQ